MGGGGVVGRGRGNGVVWGGGINISSEKHARISRSQVNSGPYTFCTAKPVICRLKGQCHEKSCSAEALV